VIGAARGEAQETRRLNDGCLTIPSSVMSAQATSASKRGSTHVVSFFLIGLESGDVKRARGSSARRIARAVFNGAGRRAMGEEGRDSFHHLVGKQTENRRKIGTIATIFANSIPD
jgi:hypothetical protein